MRRLLILIPVLLLIPYFTWSQNYQIGDVVYNPDDCTKGVVFWINPDGSEGWMVALNDISIGCAWGINENIPSLDDLTGNNVHDRHIAALEDILGYFNTNKIREFQNYDTAFAAGKTDYANGWYLPAAGQLAELYSAMPFINQKIVSNGGTVMSQSKYWSSSEYNSLEAWYVQFGIDINGVSGTLDFLSKTDTTLHVRAIRSFPLTNIVYDNSLTYLWNTGDTMPYINVSPALTTEYSVTATFDDGSIASCRTTVFSSLPAIQDFYDTICAGNVYDHFGFNLSFQSDTSVICTKKVSDGCCEADINLHLTVIGPVENIIVDSVCEGTVYDKYGFHVSVPGTYSKTCTSSNGCDSIVTLYLTVNEELDTIVFVKACDSYIANGIEFYTSGDYDIPLKTVGGCDSIVHLTLELEYTPYGVIQGDTWPIGGSELHFNVSSYNLQIENELCHVDTVLWAVDCINWRVEPVGEKGLSSNLYIYTYIEDSVQLHAMAINSCDTVESALWIHTSFYGTDEFEKADVEVMPNPNNGSVLLRFINMVGDVEVKVYSFDGKLIDDLIINESAGFGNYNYKFTDGLYGVFNFVILNNGRIITKKVVVKK